MQSITFMNISFNIVNIILYIYCIYYIVYNIILYSHYTDIYMHSDVTC